jgi:hypothetical protein
VKASDDEVLVLTTFYTVVVSAGRSDFRREPAAAQSQATAEVPLAVPCTVSPSGCWTNQGMRDRRWQPAGQPKQS